MRIIYVVKNPDDEPVMAFFDRETAEYVAKNTEGVSGVSYAAMLFDVECVTDRQIAEMMHE